MANHHQSCGCLPHPFHLDICIILGLAIDLSIAAWLQGWYEAFDHIWKSSVMALRRFRIVDSRCSTLRNSYTQVVNKNQDLYGIRECLNQVQIILLR
jgi:hypothetical protein